MKKFFAIIISILLSSTLMAGECEIESFEVNWTAFKTPNKVGVKGTFERPNLETRQDKDLCTFNFLTMTTVHIDTSSVKTDSPERDATIVKAFFKNMSGDHIDAIIKRIDMIKKELSVEITMNDITQTIYMPYTYKHRTFKAEGKIDVLNFSASPALQALNEACYEQHEGKTWSDVELSFVLKLKNECR